MYFLFKLAMVSVFTESSMALGYSELISITNDKLRSQICDMEVFVEDSRLNWLLFAVDFVHACSDKSKVKLLPYVRLYLHCELSFNNFC